MSHWVMIALVALSKCHTVLVDETESHLRHWQVLRHVILVLIGLQEWVHCYLECLVEHCRYNSLQQHAGGVQARVCIDFD